MLFGGFAWADTTESTWTGNTTTDWNTSTNWGNGLPSSTTSAEFSGTFTNQPTLGSSNDTTQGIWVTGSGNTGVTTTSVLGVVSGLTTLGGTGSLTITGTATLDGIANAGILLDGSGNNSLTISAPVTLGNSTSFVVNNSGTLTVGAINLGGNTLTLGGTYILGDDVLNGVISDGTGQGSVIVNKPGTVTLTANNTYSGGTTISAGTLEIGNFGTTGSVAGNITDNAAVEFARNDTVTYGGVISGTGSLYQVGLGPAPPGSGGIAIITAGGAPPGTGTLILTGNNTYTGGTTIGLDSTLQIGNGGTTGSIVGNVNAEGPFGFNGGGTLAFDHSDTITYGGQISGSFFLTQMGTGTLVFTGTQGSSPPFSSGTTTISSGTLQIGNGGTNGTLVGNIVDNSSLVFDHSDTITYGIGGGSNGVILSGGPIGSISGTGSVTQMGSGTLILAGPNTYSGGTTISAGTLQVEGSLGTGAVVDNASLITVGATFGDLSISNNISGGGSVTQNGAGTSLLSGTNTYTGGTAIGNGTLEFFSTTAMPASGPVAVGNTGTLAVMVGSGTGQFTTGTSGYGTIGGLLAGLGGQPGSTVTWSAGSALGLDTSNATGSVSYGPIADTSAGTLSFVKLGTGTLTLTGANTYTGSTLVSGGVLILTGNNAYAGGTTISTGTLEVSADNSLGAVQGGITLSGGGELLTEGTGGFTTSRAVAITDTGTLATVTGTTATYNGVISGAALTIGDSIHTGTVVLSGANTYTGGTTISGGTLEVGADNNLGATSGGITLSSGGVLLSDAAGGFTTGRSISITDTGTLAAVTGTTATYTGSISGGTLTIGDGTDNGTIIFPTAFTITGGDGPAVTLATDANLTNNGTITGGNGSSGGTSVDASNGNGGNGGAGVTLASGASLTNNGTITSGSGGLGGDAYGFVGDFGSGGSGGNGGAAVTLGTGASLINNGTITSGSGGNGGNSEVFDGGFGGPGGNGGVVVTLATGASLTNNGMITGGSGGSGGFNTTQYGNFNASAGDGGVATTLAAGASLTNNGTITGGNGGPTYTGGSGGDAIMASGNDMVINTGSIMGGAGTGDYGQADAIDFSGGGNTLELYSTSQISGNVVSASGNTNGGDTLELGGTTNGTFNAANIGASTQYQGFANYVKTGANTWTLTGATTAVTPWTINEGALQLGNALAIENGTVTINSANGLGFSGGIGTFTIGGLSGSANEALTDAGNNAVTLQVGNYGTSSTYSGNLSGAGAMDIVGGGSLVLSGVNSYSGGTTVSSGTLLANGGNSTGSGAVSVSSGGTLGGTGTIMPSGAGAGVAVSIAAGGTLSPSAGTGIASTLTLALQSNQSVNLLSGAKLAFDLGASGVSDQVNITGGTLTLNSQNFSDFTFITLGTFTGSGTYDLIVTGGSGDITGSLGTTTGAFVSGGNDYTGTLSVTGGDVQLSVAPIPPTDTPLLPTWALLVLVAGLFITGCRGTSRGLIG